MSKRILYLIIVLFIFSQCEDEMSDIERRQSSDDRAINSYLTTNEIPAERHESGIYYLIVEENTSGEDVGEGDIIHAKYAISVLDGDTLEINTDTIVTFEYGANSLIPTGLDIGCGLMREGEQFRFFIPSVKAFGAYWDSDLKLGPHSILICDFEIVEIQNKDDLQAIEKDSIESYIEREGIENLEEYDSGLYFKKLVTQEEGNRPENGDIVMIHFERRYLDGTIHFSTFHNNPVTFRIGYGEAVEGLEQGVKKLKPGEKALLIFPSDIGFGPSTQVIPHELRKELILDDLISNSPEPFSPLIYEIELLR